jgi:hypothetical protein
MTAGGYTVPLCCCFGTLPGNSTTTSIRRVQTEVIEYARATKSPHQAVIVAYLGLAWPGSWPQAGPRNAL